jgi:hypothetical protein
MGTNGKILAEAALDELRPSVTAGKKAGRIVLGFLPFTPVAFVGEDAWIAYARVGLYGFLAYKSFNKVRPISYGLMAAAGVSIATSLTSGAWGKK